MTAIATLQLIFAVRTLSNHSTVVQNACATRIPQMWCNAIVYSLDVMC